MRAIARLVTVALVATSFTACNDERHPVSPASRRMMATSRGASRGVVASSPGLALLMVDVSGAGLRNPLRYDIVLKDGFSESPLPLPEGKGYEVAIRGYDAKGTLTHQGNMAVEYVEIGENGSIATELQPVSEGAGYEKLDVGIKGESRLEKGWSVVIETNAKELSEGEPLHVRAHVLDAGGKQVDFDPSAFHWFIDDPRIDLFDPARPNGFDDILKSRMDQFPNRLDLGVVVGDFVTLDFLFPVKDSYLDVSAGNGVTCAVKSFGSIDCWGNALGNMLGDGVSGRRPTECSTQPMDDFFRCKPMPVAGAKLWSSVSVGGSHVCAIERTTNAAFCWGNNAVGQLGFAGFADKPTTAVSRPTGVLAFRSISAGSGHTCGVTTTGDAFCWGDNTRQQLGTTGPVSAGTLVMLPNGPYKSVTAGSGFTCAIRGTASTPECYGSSLTATRPQLVPPNGTLVMLGQASTASHACGVVNNRELWCWGWNLEGQLGNDSVPRGNIDNVAAKVRLRGGSPFLADQISTGEVHTCALAGLTAFCWGSNGSGELGTFSTIGGGARYATQVANPVGVSLMFVKISAGGRHTCGLQADGAIFCWGLNQFGQVGNGSHTPIPSGSPTAGVPTPSRVTGS